MNAAEILRGINKILNLGDLIYNVRENEGEGWEGPLVTRWSDLHKEAQKYFNAPCASWQQRIQDELVELVTKTEKMVIFFNSEKFETLPLEDRKLLNTQYFHMTNYRFVLEKRVKRLEEK